jgi:O-antigen/teichoic acid export membrane protein
VELKKQTIHGATWSAIDNVASSGITFLVGIVLARILTPTEFGIAGMIAIFIAVSNSIVESGFSAALIRKISANEKDYNTVFYFNLLVGIVLFTLLYVCAPLISRFFKEPLLISVTRVIGTVIILNAFGIIQRTILVKQIDFKTQAKISVIASVVSGIVGIGMALMGFGVWSLVGQQVSRQLFNSLLLWLYNQWRPSWVFSTKSLKDLFGFGSKLLLSGLINTIYNNIYYVIIGRFYSADQLGQYTRAEQFNSIFSSNLTNVVQRVSYPALCHIQDEEERLREAYRKVIKTTMLITFACMLGLAAVAKPLILTLIGEKWLPAVAYLQILCFSGMLYPLHAINLNILQVKGRSDLFLKLEIIKKIIGVVPIVLGIFYGIEAMLLCGVLTSIICYFLNSYYSARLINYSTKNQVEDIMPALCVSLIVAAIMWSLSLLQLPMIILLLLQCVVGLALALFIYEKMHLAEYGEVKQIAVSLLNKKWKRQLQ